MPINLKTFREYIFVFFSKIFKINIIVLNKDNYLYYKNKNIQEKNIHIIPNGLIRIFLTKIKKLKISKN